MELFIKISYILKIIIMEFELLKSTSFIFFSNYIYILSIICFGYLINIINDINLIWFITDLLILI